MCFCGAGSYGCGARSLNCAGPGTTAKVVPEGLEGAISVFTRQMPNLVTRRVGRRAGGASRGVRGRAHREGL
eukprot:13322570-Alexandrium_andersonii.AAC.1